MDDARDKRSLADDPDFLVSLSNLDRGLDGELPPSNHHRPPADPSAHRPLVARRVPLPPSIVSPFDALVTKDGALPDSAAGTAPPGSSGQPTVEPRREDRPGLVDLFPPTRSPDPQPAPDPLTVASAPLGNGDLSAATSDVAGYETFYGLHERPFALTPDPRFFFHSTTHDAVSQRLLTAIRQREGLVILTGDVGVGKTTLCRTVIEELDRRALTSFVAEPSATGEDLLKTILVDFGVMSREELARGPHATRHELSTTLISFVESLAPLQASAIVIIDEAHDLATDVLEQVRILTEAAEATALLQMVLVGQPALNTLLRRREFKALHQRVTVRCSLDPLPPDEIDGYISHRLAVAGAATAVEFDQPAIERLYRLSMGVPRVVNLLCDRVLARAFEKSTTTIDASIVEVAAEDLNLDEPRSIGQRLAARATTIAMVALGLLVGAGIAAWVFRDALTRALTRWSH